MQEESRGFIKVSIRRFLGRVTVELTAPGREFDFVKSLKLAAPLDLEELEGLEGNNNEALQYAILRSFGDNLRYKHKRGYNYISITAVRSPLASLYWTFGALLLGAAAGLLLKTFAPAAVCEVLNSEILVPVRTLFMNGLKLCAVPVVFLSIASCAAQFSDLSEIKRVAARLLACFVAAQFIAAGVGIGLFLIFLSPERVISADNIANNIAIKFKIGNAIVNLMPSNIIKPFLEGDMLQLILLAVFIGAAAAALSAKIIPRFLEECSKVFVKIITVLMRFMPLGVFCTIASLFFTMGFPVLLSLLSLSLMVIAGDVLLIIIDCLVAAFKCRLNTARLLSTSLPMMMTAFSTGSSNAAIPDSMIAAEKLGIPPKVYPLAVPLGASIDKNATCMFIVTSSLFLANIYGLNVTPFIMLSIAVSGVMLAMGAASASGIIALSMLVSQLGCPIEAVGLVMGIYPLLKMFNAAANCFGIMTSALVCGKTDL